MHEPMVKERHANSNGFKVTDIKRVQAIKLRKAQAYDNKMNNELNKFHEEEEKIHEEAIKNIEDETFGKRKSNKDKKKLQNLKKGYESSEDASEN